MGLYSIITRSDGIVLTAFNGTAQGIWNDDHQNHVTHTEPDSINSFESDVAEMNLEVAPTNAAGTIVSRPAAMSDEFTRMRYTLSRLKALVSSGTFPAHWYTLVSAYSGLIALPSAAMRREAAAAFDIPSGIETNISTVFTTSLYNTLGTNFIAPVTGIYWVGMTLAFGDGVVTGPAQDFRLTLKRGTSSFTPIASRNIFTGATSGPKAITVETIARFTASQAVQGFAFQNSGSTKQPVSTANARPAMWMALIGR